MNIKNFIAVLCLFSGVGIFANGQSFEYPKFSATEIAKHIEAGSKLAANIRKAAKDLSIKEYVVPPGHYGFNMTEMVNGAPSGFILSDIRRPDNNPFTVKADSVTFWFVPTDKPAPNFSRALHIANCDNISLVGATLDSYSSLYIEGILTAIDRTENRIEIQLLPGSISEESMIQNTNRAESRIIPRKADGRAMPALYNINDTWGPEYLWISKAEKSAEGKYWLTFRSDQLLSITGEDNWKNAYGDDGVLEVGDCIAFVYGSVLGIALDNCKQISMRNINCYIPRGGFWENGGYGNHRWTNCRFEPRPNSNRLMGGEGSMTQGIRVGSTYDGLYFGITSDDAINIHGFWSRLKSVAGRIISVDYAPVGIQAGDPVEFYTPDGHLVHTGIVSVTPEPKYNYNGFLNVPIELTAELPSSATACIIRWPESECAGWTIKNCTFESVYQRILIQSGPGVFENNRIFRMGSNLALDSKTSEDYEGGFLKDITIKDNVFIFSAICPNYSPIYLSFNADWAERMSATDIKIQNNLFVGAGAAILHARNVKGLTFSGNVAETPFITDICSPSLMKSNTVCHITNSSDIRITDNILIEQRKCATGNKFINEGIEATLSNNHAFMKMGNENNMAIVQPVPLDSIVTKGELALRIGKNFDRLEEGKYRPDSVFLTEEQSGGWPGDTEGRTILGLVLDARASKREPVYLQEIIENIPRHLNREGYMGPIYEYAMNEQQLSGNGWMLRGLCEYYEWKKDEKVLSVIASIVNNLFVKGKGFYRKYPIDSAVWKSMEGAEAGSIQKTVDGWMLSSDIGCVFIGMEGAIHAYKHLRSEELKEVIQEMLARFLEIDLMGIKAQTHASLTACRGLIRYAEITGERKYVDEAAKRWQWYKQNGITENFENYNWFGRFDTWAESCAVVDSYMLAVQLWQYTHEAQYLHDAELIYYNAICHMQRHNGGFGCDNCPGEAIHDPNLKVHISEAYWCCTMRGGEGLSRAAEYSCFAEGTNVYIPFFHENEIYLPVGLKIRQHTSWPFEGKVRFVIEENTAGTIALHLRMPLRTARHQLRYNGIEYPLEQEKQFVVLKREFRAGDEIEWTFDPVVEIASVHSDNTKPGEVEIFYGPLMLGCENDEVVKLTEKDKIIPVGTSHFKLEGKEIYFTPVYHLMDPAVWENTKYKKQIIF